MSVLLFLGLLAPVAGDFDQSLVNRKYRGYLSSGPSLTAHGMPPSDASSAMHSTWTFEEVAGGQHLYHIVNKALQNFLGAGDGGVVALWRNGSAGVVGSSAGFLGSRRDNLVWKLVKVPDVDVHYFYSDTYYIINEGRQMYLAEAEGGRVTLLRDVPNGSVASQPYHLQWGFAGPADRQFPPPPVGELEKKIVSVSQQAFLAPGPGLWVQEPPANATGREAMLTTWVLAKARYSFWRWQTESWYIINKGLGSYLHIGGGRTLTLKTDPLRGGKIDPDNLAWSLILVPGTTSTYKVKSTLYEVFLKADGRALTTTKDQSSEEGLMWKLVDP